MTFASLCQRSASPCLSASDNLFHTLLQFLPASAKLYQPLPASANPKQPVPASFCRGLPLLASASQRDPIGTQEKGVQRRLPKKGDPKRNQLAPRKRRFWRR